MVLTKTPSATGVSELWHAVSLDGRTWTVDRSALAVNPGTPLNQPAWGINGATARIYYRAQPNGSNVIASGVVRFNGATASVVDSQSPAAGGASGPLRQPQKVPRGR
jgi:hypothetical protein